MANVFPPVRTESRIPEKVLVELYSLENVTHEITSTINISSHGVCVLTKAPLDAQSGCFRSVGPRQSLFARTRRLLQAPSGPFLFHRVKTSSTDRGLAGTQQSFRFTPATLIPHRRLDPDRANSACWAPVRIFPYRAEFKTSRAGPH
jgi:hypothetical protein